MSLPPSRKPRISCDDNKTGARSQLGSVSESGLLNAHHARRVNDVPPCAEGFSKDHISPPCRIGSENIPKSKHSEANIALSPGRIACTRGDIKADETGSYGLASGVNSQTASPTGSSAGATPRDLALPAMPADTSYAYSDTNKISLKPPLGVKKAASYTSLARQELERSSTMPEVDASWRSRPVSPRRPKTRRSSRILMEKINFRLDSRVEFHMPNDVVQPPQSFREHANEILGFIDAEDEGAEEEQDEASTSRRDGEASIGRDRVYNLLVHVPCQFERAMFFGALISLDSFLTVTFAIPFRGFKAFCMILFGYRRQLTPEAVIDMAWVLMIVAGVAILLLQDVAVLYHFIRGQEVVKLYVIFNVLEMCERLLNSFGADTLDAVSYSAGRMMSAPEGARVREWRRKLAADTAVGTVVVVLHSMVMLMQAITINVAINSKSNQLLALLISNNFVEMKGSVFKKTDARRHLQMTCLDIYERYHMQICLLFVMIEMLNKSKGGEIDWMRTFIWQLMPLFLFEFVVDHLKHAFLCKFNEIQPNVFRDYLAELCRRTTHFSMHNCHRLLVCEPMAATCLVIRTLLTLRPWKGGEGRLHMLTWGAVIFVGLLALKAVLSWVIQKMAWRYMESHRKKFPNLYIVDSIDKKQK